MRMCQWLAETLTATILETKTHSHKFRHHIVSYQPTVWALPSQSKVSSLGERTLRGGLGPLHTELLSGTSYLLHNQLSSSNDPKAHCSPEKTKQTNKQNKMLHSAKAHVYCTALKCVFRVGSFTSG